LEIPRISLWQRQNIPPLRSDPGDPGVRSDPAFINLFKPAQPSRDLLGKQTANNSH
jgi:hypothetical protein